MYIVCLAVMQYQTCTIFIQPFWVFGVQVLDLSDRRIRHCGDVFESINFENLRELNLNNNMISAVDPLK